MSEGQAALRERAGFGTFTGVVRPVALTILGAMLYLREGWLVGQAGILGSLLIIALAVSITGTTALSLASVASNVRVKPGGAFAIISQALGLEAGGAIGVPLYIAQAASSAMYVYAFTEAWAYLFPAHGSGWVAMVAYGALAVLAYVSANLAFKAQAYMMWVIALALVSGALGLFTVDSVATPVWIGGFAEASPVDAFAIFFPAVTGIMVGAGMSGSLADPRRAIPRGTLIAWGATSAIYALFAVWYGFMGSPEELMLNKTLIIDKALFPPLVICGLLVSTLMAALSSLVAAPRLLQAMAERGILPASQWLSQTTASGEPRNAVLVTTALGGLGLLAGSLDAIAPIITSFFIMAYLAINGVVYVEQTLGMISFRPSFRIATSTPLIGVGLCLVGLAAGSPFGGMLELAVVLSVYALIARRKIETPWETVRSGIAVTVADWAARRVAHMDRGERAWKPDLLVPVASVYDGLALKVLAEDLARRNGSVRWVGIGTDPDLGSRLEIASARERRTGLFASWTQLRTTDQMLGVSMTLDALRGALFPPNLVLLHARRVTDAELDIHLERCRELAVGFALYVAAEDGQPAKPGKTLDVWLSDRSPDWTLELHLQNLDLPVLVAFLLAESWNARIRLRTAVRDPAEAGAAGSFLHALIDQARLPASTEIMVSSGSFEDALREDHGDLNLFGMPPTVSLHRLSQIRDLAGGPCLWLLDSGGESALA